MDVELDPKSRLVDNNKLAKILDLEVQGIRNQLCNGPFPIPSKKIGELVQPGSRDVEKFLNNLKPLTKATCSENNG